MFQHYEDSSSNVIVFKNPLSNFSRVTFLLLENTRNQLSMPINSQKLSAVHNNPCVAQKAREAETALDAKRIGQTVIGPTGWKVMVETESVSEVKKQLEAANSDITFRRALGYWLRPKSYISYKPQQMAREE